MLIVQEQVRNGPRFPVGMPVRIDRYFGVDPIDHGTGPANGRVRSIRLEADVTEEWVGDGPTEDSGYYRDVVTYPHGWEYQIASDRQGRVWGWVTEAELIDKGYAPPVTTLADLAALEVPPLSVVDPEAADIGTTPNVGSDMTRRDLRGAAR